MHIVTTFLLLITIQRHPFQDDLGRPADEHSAGLLDVLMDAPEEHLTCTEHEPLVVEDRFGAPLWEVPGTGYEECCDGSGLCCRNYNDAKYECD